MSVVYASTWTTQDRVDRLDREWAFDAHYISQMAVWSPVRHGARGGRKPTFAKSESWSVEIAELYFSAICLPYRVMDGLRKLKTLPKALREGGKAWVIQTRDWFNGGREGHSDQEHHGRHRQVVGKDLEIPGIDWSI